jgi:hypothetical protein
MLGSKLRGQSEFLMAGSLRDLIPDDHVLARVDRVLDLAVVVSDDHPALRRARRRKERWSKDDAHLYQRHRWRSEGFHVASPLRVNIIVAVS